MTKRDKFYSKGETHDGLPERSAIDQIRKTASEPRTLREPQDEIQRKMVVQKDEIWAHGGLEGWKRLLTELDIGFRLHKDGKGFYVPCECDTGGKYFKAHLRIDGDPYPFPTWRSYCCDASYRWHFGYIGFFRMHFGPDETHKDKLPKSPPMVLGEIDRIIKSWGEPEFPF